MSVDALHLLEAISLKRAELRYCERLDNQSRRWNFKAHSHPYFELPPFLDSNPGRGGSFDVAPFDLVLHPPRLPRAERSDSGRHHEVTYL